MENTRLGKRKIACVSRACKSYTPTDPKRSPTSRWAEQSSEDVVWKPVTNDITATSISRRSTEKTRQNTDNATGTAAIPGRPADISFLRRIVAVDSRDRREGDRSKRRIKRTVLRSPGIEEDPEEKESSHTQSEENSAGRNALKKHASLSLMLRMDGRKMFITLEIVLRPVIMRPCVWTDLQSMVLLPRARRQVEKKEQNFRSRSRLCFRKNREQSILYSVFVVLWKFGRNWCSFANFVYTRFI